MAETSATYHAIIEIVNRATAPIRKINAEIAGMLAPITAVKVAMGTLATETGLTAVGEDAAVAMERVGALGRRIAALAAPLGLIAIPLSFAGIAEASKKSAEFGEALQRAHERTGEEVPVLARLHYAGQMSDIDPAAMDKALEQLNARIFKARGGQDKQMDAMFSKFAGAEWRQKIGSAEQAFEVLSDAMRKNENAAVRQGIVMTAFGQRVGAQMTPLLLRGGDAIKKLGDEFEAMYGKWTPERARQATENAEDWKRLSAAGQGLALTIGSAITPEMQKLIVPLREWIIANKEMIGTKVDHAVQQIAEALKQVDWRGIADAVKDVWGAFKDLGEMLGAKGVIFLGTAAIFGPMAMDVLKTAGALAKLTKSMLMFVGVSEAMVTLQVASFFKDLVLGLRATYPLMVAVDLAMAANPIGAVVLAVAAFGVALWGVYEAYKAIENAVSHSKAPNYHGNVGGAGGLPSIDNVPGVRPKNGPIGPAIISHVVGPNFRSQGGANGKVDVHVKVDAPPGTTTKATKSGDNVNLNVGKSFAR